MIKFLIKYIAGIILMSVPLLSHSVEKTVPFATVDRPLPLFMIITENKNNPTSTIILGNPNLNMSCIFMTGKDFLLPTEADSLPAKQPSEEGPKLGV